MTYRSSPDPRRGRLVSRRQFSLTTGVAVLGSGAVGLALLDKPRAAHTTIGSTVLMGDPANPTPAYFVRPEKGRHPGVVFWRKGETMTEDERAEARDLSEKGYAVLVIDHSAGNGRTVPYDAVLATWWLKQQQQVNARAGIGTPEWAKARLEPRVRV
jgi:hypothetical protein